MIKNIQLSFIFLIFISPAISIFHVWPLNSVVPDGLVLFSISVLFSVSLFSSAIAKSLSFSMLATLPLLLVFSFSVSFFFEALYINSSYYWCVITLFLISALSVSLAQVRMRELEFQAFICKALALSGIVYSIFSLAQYYGFLAVVMGLPAPKSARLIGVWQQPNLTTSTLWIAFFSAVYLCRDNRKLIKILLFSLLTGVTLALAASRLNLLIVPFCLGIGGWLMCSKLQWRTLMGRQAVAGTLVIVSCLLIIPDVSEPIEHKLVQAGWLSDTTRVALSERNAADRPRIEEHIKIFKSLPEWSLQQWLFGRGVGQYGFFSFEQPVAIFNPAGSQSAWLHSHNLFTTIFVESGFIGLAASLVVIVVLNVVIWRGRHKRWAVPAFGVFGVVFFHSMVEYPLWYPWYIAVLVFFLAPFFKKRRILVTSPRLFFGAASSVLVVVLALSLNLGSQVWTILSLAVTKDSSEDSYRRLSLLANDGLLGPYAVLAKYRLFSPELNNLDWQLNEAERMTKWRPLDIVELRRVTLILMSGRLEQGCREVRQAVERYPSAGPIIVEKALRMDSLDEEAINRISECAERGLDVWGETLDSMRARNHQRMSR